MTPALPNERATVAYEVVVRFFPGAGREADAFFDSLDLPEQAYWKRLERIVVPDGEEREHMRSTSRSIFRPEYNALAGFRIWRGR